MHLSISIKPMLKFALSVFAAGQLFLSVGQPLLTINGELTDIEGNLIGAEEPESFNVVVRVFGQETGGVALYTETFSSTNSQEIRVNKGHFSVVLGSGTTTDQLQTVLQSSTNLWVELSVDNDILSRAPITASPYVLLNSTTIQTPAGK